MEPLLLVHAIATWYMTGLIWFVQVVHYPLMSKVGTAGFAEYEEAHTRRTGWVVGPPMLIEAATAVLLLFVTTSSDGWLRGAVGVALLAVIWLSTAFQQVPQHRRLLQGFDPAAHERLVATNWIRVAAWTARAVLVSLWLSGR